MCESIYARLSFASDCIETPYAAFLADDNFYIPHCLVTCIKLIEKHDLAACCGRFLSFHQQNGQVYAQPRWHDHLEKTVIDDGDPASRIHAMNFALPPYIIYGVHRADVFRKNMRIFRGQALSNVYASEYQFALMTVLQGKVRLVDELLRLNSLENRAVRDSEFNRKIKFDEWYYDPVMQHEVNAYYQAMRDGIQDMGLATSDSLCAAMKDWTEALIVKKRKKRVYVRINKTLFTGSGIVGRIVPTSIKMQLRRFIGKELNCKRGDSHYLFKTLGECVEDMRRQDCMVAMDDLREIETIVVNFHNRNC